jgi:drug/metabolite transporter (DMT)-like permease
MTSTRPTVWQLTLVLVAGVLAVSTAAPLVRLAMHAASERTVGFSFVLAAARLTLASVLLLPQWRRMYTAKPSAQAVRSAIAAGLALAIHFATWITSLSLTSVVASTALVTTNPIWVALLSWVWLKEKPTRQAVLGTSIALAGGLLIGWGGLGTLAPGSHPLWGDGLALVGAWAASGYLLLGREAQRHGLGIGSYVVLAYSTAAIALIPLPLLAGASYVGYSPTVYGYILLTALIPQLIGHTSFNWVVRWISPTLVTLVILLEPVLASVLAFLLFQEMPNITGLMGALLILVGVGITALV